jgi:hypothetical protein
MKAFDWHSDPITRETPTTSAYRNTPTCSQSAGCPLRRSRCELLDSLAQRLLDEEAGVRRLSVCQRWQIKRFWLLSVSMALRSISARDATLCKLPFQNGPSRHPAYDSVGLVVVVRLDDHDERSVSDRQPAAYDHLVAFELHDVLEMRDHDAFEHLDRLRQ